MLGSVRLELRSAFESIQPVLINLGRPKFEFEFDSAHVKYGRSEPDLRLICLAAKYNVASLQDSTRITGQSCVNEDGAFFHSI